jgi:hypothetical protein
MKERLRDELEKAIRYADEKCPPLIDGNYCEYMAEYLLANGVIILPPGVRPYFRAVRKPICNQYLLTKEMHIQWCENTLLASEEEAERITHEFIKDWSVQQPK